MSLEETATLSLIELALKKHFSGSDTEKHQSNVTEVDGVYRIHLSGLSPLLNSSDAIHAGGETITVDQGLKDYLVKFDHVTLWFTITPL